MNVHVYIYIYIYPVVDVLCALPCERRLIIMEASYYTNPFAGSDDAMCYAEIDMDEMERAPSTSSTSLSAAATAATIATTSAAAIDAGAAAMQQLRRQLEESQAAQQAIRRQYEDSIAQMRATLMELQEENGQLRASQSGVEAKLAELQLEREDLTWSVRQERERGAALQSRLSALETERDIARGRTQSVLEQLKSMRQPRAAVEEAGESSAMLHPAEKEVHSMERRPDPVHMATGVRNSRGGGGILHVNTNLQGGQAGGQVSMSSAAAQGGGYAAEMTESEKERARAQERAAVEQLESELLQHSRARDRLEGELNRLESVRSRTVAQRRHRAEVERELAVEEQRIGQIKLQLRTMAALTR